MLICDWNDVLSDFLGRGGRKFILESRLGDPSTRSF